MKTSHHKLSARCWCEPLKDVAKHAVGVNQLDESHILLYDLQSTLQM